MKNISKYTFWIIALVLCSCEKADVTGSDIDLVPKYGYIRFSTGIATKAPIIENLRNKSFGVMGYIYDSDWATARPLAEPELFYKQVVECDENGVCEYTNDEYSNNNGLVPWDVDKVYSFFGYYPINDAITISGETDKNMPTASYSLPLSTDSEVSPASMLDLMTAYSIDQTARGTGYVAFKFQHRLFCIEVIAQNFNEDTEAVDADVKISDLKLKIENIAYSSITVPMQKGDSDPKKTEFSGGPVTFDLSGGGETTIPSYDDSPNSVNVSGDEYVMLIPQDNSPKNDITVTPLTGTVEFNLTDSEGTTPKQIGFESALNFQEGKKYTVIINFTGESIIIIVAEAGSWEPNLVEYDFE